MYNNETTTTTASYNMPPPSYPTSESANYYQTASASNESNVSQQQATFNYAYANTPTPSLYEQNYGYVSSNSDAYSQHNYYSMPQYYAQFNNQYSNQYQNFSYSNYYYQQQQQHHQLSEKPATPTPTVASTVQPAPQTTLNLTNPESTPEKPIMNDSGIEIISPQLANSTQSSTVLSANTSNASPSTFNSSASHFASVNQLNSIYSQTQYEHQSAAPLSNQEVLKPTYSFQNVSYAYKPAQQAQQLETSKQENQQHAAESNSKVEYSKAVESNQADVEVEDDENDEEENEQDEEETVKENIKESNGSKKSKGNKASIESDDPSKPPKPYLEIIADAILSSKVKMMQLHEIYYYMEKKFQYFAKNVNKSWRNSVRHNLSLNECFVKAGRGSNGKGNYWKIHSLCEREFMRGNFRRKSFKQLIRAGTSAANHHQMNQQFGGHDQSALGGAFNMISPNLATYTLPLDYSLNYKSIQSLIPPPAITQQFLNINKTNSIQQYEQLYNQAQESSNESSAVPKPTAHRYHPYRV